MNHSEDPNLHSASELDHDALNFSCLEEYLNSDVAGIFDGAIDGTGLLNFGFGTDDSNSQDNLFPLSLGARYNGVLTFPADGYAASAGVPIDIPTVGGHLRRKNSPLTPPDSDCPDSPDADQVFLNAASHVHPSVQPLVPHCLGIHQLQQQGAINHASDELLSRTFSVFSEPKRKRKRSSECRESLTTDVLSSLRLESLKSESDDYSLDSSSSEGTGSPDPLTVAATPDPENTYQCLKWSPFKSDEYCSIYDESMQVLPPPLFRVDADKGFNYSFADEAFVCQKKNHLQVTAYMNLQSEQCPKFVKGENELRHIEKFCLHLYGVKMESQASKIGVEQSQADRSKRHYQPLQFHISPKAQAKITVGRLHFSETTANNMRKKGKPNPDQRYFLLVVAVYAHTKNKEFLVCGNVSERIIVRASNPGQFENDMEVVWSRGQTTDSVFRMGRVGVNTDKPEEALSVHGNLKLTGRLVHPSDIRIKESIEEVDTREQLRNVSKMKLYRYRYSHEYLQHAGLTTQDFEDEDTGVLAQEMKEVLPEAVKESEDLVLSDGKVIERFLVVNKERIFMENVGAVKELCKLTDNLEVRIDELEIMNQRLQRRRCDTVSTFSSLSLSRASSFRASVNSKKQNEDRAQKCRHHHHHCHHHHHHCVCRNRGVTVDEQNMCSSKFMQFIILILVVITVGCAVAIVVLTIPNARHNNSGPGDDTPSTHFTSEENGSFTTSVTTSQTTVTTSSIQSSSPSPHSTTDPSEGNGSFTTSVTTSQTTVTTSSIQSSSPSPHSTTDPSEGNGSFTTSVTTSQTTVTTSSIQSSSPSPHPTTDPPVTSPDPDKGPTERTSFGKTTTTGKPGTGISTSTTFPPGTPTTHEATSLSSGSTVGPHSCCSNTRSTEVSQIFLQSIVVYSPGSDMSLSSASRSSPQSGETEVRLVEHNYIIKCTNCSYENSSHYIPFSRDLPFQPVTLEINSTSNSLMLLCSNHSEHECPEQDTQPLYDTCKKKDSWRMSHRWKLPVAYYYESTYHFRLFLSRSATNVSCEAKRKPSDPNIRDLYFHFIRYCH
ncbi:myelin regulatory factor-like [Montipora capricornis]|uniref:myelin regulatory factor-like n=1 Tax=Montipora capricornis TaxID=246305 RepID=UPI0035F1FCF8